MDTYTLANITNTDLATLQQLIGSAQADGLATHYANGNTYYYVDKEWLHECDVNIALLINN